MYSDSIANTRRCWCCSSSYISMSLIIIIVLIIIIIVTTIITTKSPQGITIIYPIPLPHRPTTGTSERLTKSESKTGTLDRSDAWHMRLKLLHPGKLAWNLKHSVWETTFLWGRPIFRVNVSKHLLWGEPHYMISFHDNWPSNSAPKHLTPKTKGICRLAQ